MNRRHQEEAWVTIEKYPNYQISSFGNVRKIKKICNRDTSPLFKNMAGTMRKGYIAFGIRTTYGKRCFKSAHVLVLEAFIGPRPDNGSVLNECQIIEIKKLLKLKMKHKDIANLYGVARSTISQINTGLNWGYINDY